MEHNSSPNAPEKVGAPDATGWEELTQYAPDPRNAVVRKAEELRDFAADAMDKHALDSAEQNAAVASDENELAQMENRVRMGEYDERLKEGEAKRHLRESEKAVAMAEKAADKNLADYIREKDDLDKSYDRQRKQMDSEGRKINSERDKLEAEYIGKEAEIKEIDEELDDLDAEARELSAEIAEFREETGDVDAMRANLEDLKTKLDSTRSKSMRNIRRSKVRALEKEIKDAQENERMLASLDKELEKIGRRIDKAKDERGFAVRAMESITQRTEVLKDRLTDIDRKRTALEYDYSQNTQAAAERFDSRRSEVMAEREKVREQYGAEAAALGRELVGGADGSGELIVRGRIERAKEAVSDALASFAAGVRLNVAGRRAAKAEAKLFARETILAGKREKSEATQSELERRAKGRELEAEQIRTSAEARRDAKETEGGLKQLEISMQEDRAGVEQKRSRDAVEAENDAAAAEADAEALANYYPTEEARIRKELAENEAEIQELSDAGDRGALEQEVTRLQARFDRAHSRTSKRLAEQKLKRAKEDLKDFDIEEKANKEEIVLLTADNEALRAELEQLEKEKAEIAAEVKARAERAEARAKGEEGYSEAEKGISEWYGAQRSKLEGEYEDRKHAREERLAALLEAYRPEVMAVGSAVLEEEAVVVTTTKTSFFKKLRAAIFSL